MPVEGFVGVQVASFGRLTIITGMALTVFRGTTDAEYRREDMSFIVPKNDAGDPFLANPTNTGASGIAYPTTVELDVIKPSPKTTPMPGPPTTPGPGGTPYPPISGCQLDTDCPIGDTCVGGICVPGFLPPPPSPPWDF